MSKQGTILNEIDKKINDTVLIPVQMLENIETNGLELKNNQTKFKANLEAAVQILKDLVAGAQQTYTNFYNKSTDLNKQIAKEEKEYLLIFAIILGCNAVNFSLIMLGLKIRNGKYHICTGIIVIICGFTAIGFISFQAQNSSKILKASNMICLYND